MNNKLIFGIIGITLIISAVLIFMTVKNYRDTKNIVGDNSESKLTQNNKDRSDITNDSDLINITSEDQQVQQVNGNAEVENVFDNSDTTEITSNKGTVMNNRYCSKRFKDLT